MRRNIKLTGRKDIPFNAFTMDHVQDNDAVSLEIPQGTIFENFDTDASIVLRMTENKFTEYLRFGSIASPEPIVTPEHTAFSAPTCQLRVLSTKKHNLGMVLGSTNTWTLKMKSDGDNDSTGEGILHFLPSDIAPRTWKLDIREDEHPVLYVDKEIPEPTDWARRDPTFRATVMPAVVERVMHHLLADDNNTDFDWAQEWYSWSETFLPDEPKPIGGEEMERERWVGMLLDEFCRRYRFHDTLLSNLIKDE